MEHDWPFFAGLISNAEMACAKADMGIGRRYADLCEDRGLRDRIWSRIEAEFDLTREEVVRVTGGSRLLDREPAIQRSIDRRNPYIDTLSFVQLELLRRARAGEGGDQLTRASFLAINGIAGACGTPAEGDGRLSAASRPPGRTEAFRPARPATGPSCGEGARSARRSPRG